MNFNLRLLKLLGLPEDMDETNPISTKRMSTRVHGGIHSIQRSIKKLREEYMVPIENIKGKGYYLIDKKYWQNAQNIARFLEMETTIELLKGAFVNNKNSLIHVALEKNDQFKGLEYIKLCLEAIESNKVLEFKHTKFNSSVEKYISYNFIY